MSLMRSIFDLLTSVKIDYFNCNLLHNRICSILLEYPEISSVHWTKWHDTFVILTVWCSFTNAFEKGMAVVTRFNITCSIWT